MLQATQQEWLAASELDVERLVSRRLLAIRVAVLARALLLGRRFRPAGMLRIAFGGLSPAWLPAPATQFGQERA